MEMARKLAATASKKTTPEAQKRVRAMAATFKKLAQNAAKPSKVAPVKAPGGLKQPAKVNPWPLPPPSSDPPAGSKPLATKPATPLDKSLPPPIPTAPKAE
jgi:hypothetical protein